jgi:rhodanese-related sulfurtransferase
VTDTEQTTSELSPDEAEALISEGADLVDVRRPYEFEGGRITGARNVEMNELTAAAESLPRERPLVFYCRGGNRSQMAAQAFREAGFDAHHIAGGIQAWADSGRALDPEDGEIRDPKPPTA